MCICSPGSVRCTVIYFCQCSISFKRNFQASSRLKSVTAYTSKVSKLEERPDYTVWEKLSTKLDTASVWDRLVVSLNRHEQYIWWRNVIIRGTAVFLLLTTSYMTYNNYVGNTEKQTISNDDLFFSHDIPK